MGVARDITYDQFKNATVDTVLGWGADGISFHMGAFTGAVAPSTDGLTGLVPKPVAADVTRVLRGNGAWADIFPSATPNILPRSTGNGDLTASDVYYDSSVNALSIKKAGGSTEFPYRAGVFGLGGFDRKSVTLNNSRYRTEMLWHDTGVTPVASGTADIDVFLALEDVVILIELFGLGIKNDGSEGYTCVKNASFRRDAAATPVIIGAVTTVSEHKDDGVDNPAITIAMNAGNVRVSFTTGSADLYAWTIWSKITVLKL